MPPPAKKQKRGTTSQPETVVSTSTTGEATVAAGPDVLVTKGQMNQMLRRLRDSDTVDQAIKAMKALYNKIDIDVDENAREIDVDENAREVATAKMIVELEGVGIIHAAMKDWNAQSGDFSRFALGCLVQLTHLVKKATITLVRLGGIKTIAATAEKHKKSRYPLVTSRAVVLLYNISCSDDNETKEEVVVDACTHLVLEAMKKWASDASIQDAGCDYFNNISTVDNIKAKLRWRGICSVLGNVIDKFIDSDDDEKKKACNAAQSALDEYRKP